MEQVLLTFDLNEKFFVFPLFPHFYGRQEIGLKKKEKNSWVGLLD